jgi:hypothetical protein
MLTLQEVVQTGISLVRYGMRRNFLARFGGGMVLLLVGLHGSTFSQDISDALRLSGPGLTFSARALGMGNAHSTIGYDFSAVRLNPATLGNIRASTYSASINTNAFPGTSEYNQIESYFATTSTSFSQLGIAIPFMVDSSNFVLSLGYTQSKDFNQSLKYGAFNPNPNSVIQELTAQNNEFMRALGLSYQDFDPVTNEYLGDKTIINGNLDESGFILDQGGLIHFSAGTGFELMPGVFFGASGSYTVGTYLSDREYYERDTQNNYDTTTQTNPADPRTRGFQQFYLHDVRDVEYSGWDFKFGVLYKFYNFVAISAAFKIPTAHSVSEIRNVSGFAEYEAGRLVNTQGMETETLYKVTPPYEATVGAMINLWILTGTLEATYVDYTQMTFSGGNIELPARTLAIKEVKERLTQVLNVNGGAEFRLPWTGLSARAGFMYRPSPFKDDPMEFDTKVVTAGLGINSNDRLMFDVGYAVGFWTQRGNQYGLEDLTQEVVTHNVLISVKFAF